MESKPVITRFYWLTIVSLALLVDHCVSGLLAQTKGKRTKRVTTGGRMVFAVPLLVFMETFGGGEDGGGIS